MYNAQVEGHVIVRKWTSVQVEDSHVTRYNG